LVKDYSKYLVSTSNPGIKRTKLFLGKMDDMGCVTNERKCSKIQGILEHLKSNTLQKQFNTDTCRIITFMGLYLML
jgi:hypothetical protein